MKQADTCFVRSCEAKVRYDTPALARRALQHVPGGQALEVYGPCYECDGYHLGAKKARERKRA